MKRIVLFFTLFLSINYSITAQVGTFSYPTQQFVLLNPAYAGAQDQFNVTLFRAGLLKRNIDRLRPNSTAVSGHGRIGKKKVWSVGASYQLSNTYYSTTNEYQTYVSYRTKLGEERQLSFGLSTSLLDYSLSVPTLPSIENAILPNIGSGLFYEGKKMVVGISVPRVIGGYRTVGNDQVFQPTPLHFLWGFDLPMTKRLRLRPMTLVEDNSLFTAKEDWYAKAVLNHSLAVVIDNKLSVGGNLTHTIHERSSVLLAAVEVPVLSGWVAYESTKGIRLMASAVITQGSVLYLGSLTPYQFTIGYRLS